MASTDFSVDSEKVQPRRGPWRKRTQRFSQSLFCCSCFGGEEKDPLKDQEKKMNGWPRHPRLDQKGSGERDAIQITVKNLGIVNTSFSLFEEDLLTSRDNTDHSDSSVSASPRALQQKQLQHLSSLPITQHTKQAIASTSAEDYKEEEDTLPLESVTDSLLVNLLTPPVINLIPPTPSNVIDDDDQFFDISSEENMPPVSESDGSFAALYQGNFEKKTESESKESKEGFSLAEVGNDCTADISECRTDQCQEEREALPTKDGSKENSKLAFSRSAYQVPPLPEYPVTRKFNTGINLLTFTEHNLDDLCNKDDSFSEALRTEHCLPPKATIMDTIFPKRRQITRSCSLGETLIRIEPFQELAETVDQPKEEKGLLGQRRVTVESYIPPSKDLNGNYPEKGKQTFVCLLKHLLIVERTIVFTCCNMLKDETQTNLLQRDEDKYKPKSLSEMDTNEVCQWFAKIGLQKCLPFIQDSKLCGVDIASIDVNTLDILHIITPEDREHLLAAVYNELHPPSIVTRRLDYLLETLGPNHVDTFTAMLVSMSKSNSVPHVSCLSKNRRSLKMRNDDKNYLVQKNSPLLEITINVMEQIVHLRTPKETTVGKIMESCLKMLGMTEDGRLFSIKEQRDSSAELSPDQQIGSLLRSPSEGKQLELHVFKLEKPLGIPSENNPDVKNSDERCDKNIQPAKEERIRELKQQVDSLQNVIHQVQELHHSLVAFCSELKTIDGDVNTDSLGSAELKQKLELFKSRMNDKRQSLQTLRDHINNSEFLKKQLDVRLLEKMKLNCQVFKEEISMVHLNRQVVHLQNALQESYIKEKALKSLAIGSLGQLVSPQSPAILFAVQESQGPDGRYGFTCHYSEGNGLLVDKVDNSNLCVDDRLVEVNGVPVVNSTHEELKNLLLNVPSAKIIVLRQPPPGLTPCQNPLPRHTTNSDSLQNICSEKDPTATETPSWRKVMAI